jgi:hypothetical protein
MILTGIYLLICWLSGEVSVNLDLLYPIVFIDSIAMITEFIYRMYKVKHNKF